MSRIAGIELQDNIRLDFALTKIRGIGWPLSRKVVETLKMNAGTRLKDLSADDIAKITAELDNYTIEGDLARVVRGDIKRLQAIGSYRGMRHSRGLPVHGQRTRSNARTKRGKRKTVGAFKKEMLTKQAPAGDSK
jgi:small subunit ribosomal protein S13